MKRLLSELALLFLIFIIMAAVFLGILWIYKERAIT